MAGTLKNFYETLGVPRSATDEQIKTAYRKLILKFHPDKNVGDTYFEDWSKKVIEAFEVLSDPQLRAEYDQVYDEHKRAAKRNYQETAPPAPEPEPDPEPEQEPPPSPVPEPEAVEEESEVVVEEDAAQATFSPVIEEDEEVVVEKDERVPAEFEPAVEEVEEVEPEAAFEEKIPAEEPVVDTNAMQMVNRHLEEYIDAKQDYFIAQRDMKGYKPQKAAPAQKRPSNNVLPVVAICLLLIIGSVVWLVMGKSAAVKEELGPQGTVEMPPREMYVASDKAYFYKDPQNITQPSREYLTKGMKLVVSKKYRNLYYGVYQTRTNQDYKMEGWLRAEDLR